MRRGLNDTFVVVKVYVGDENYNRDFFSQLPEARGAPHFWIISPQREVLASQSTGEFERDNRGYDRAGIPVVHRSLEEARRLTVPERRAACTASGGV